MPVPGLGAAHGGLTLVLDSANTTYDLAAALGNPSGAVFYTLIVPSGVVRGAPDASNPAIDASGLHVDSEGFWIVEGDVYGAGGAGGGHTAGVFPLGFSPGGGGGGAGTEIGSGGTAVGAGTNGSDGTATTGGSGGSNNAANASIAALVVAENGGDAIALNHSVTVLVTGSIRGGGGGGSHPTLVSDPPGDGGDLDQPGTGSLPGAAGYAVRLSGSGAWSASGGGIVGTVG